MASTNPARGMRDFLPVDVRKRNYVIGIIKEVYESYGFEPLETPAVENIETLMGKYGEEGNQLVFKILKRGEKLDLANTKTESDLSDLALRYDLTVPLARVVANNKNDLPKFFKRYQIQPVWRADRPARGRFREFYQCDVDAIGSESMVVEAELISSVVSVLRKLGFVDFYVRVNHRQILTSVLSASGIPKRLHIKTLISLDKMVKVGARGLVQEFLAFGMKPETALKFLKFLLGTLNLGASTIQSETRVVLEATKALESATSIEEVLRIDQFVEAARHSNTILLERVAGYLHDDAIGLKALGDIRSMFEKLLAGGVASEARFDLRLARGLSYYTGAIMEVEIGKQIGSLGGGGRYDGLIGMFGKEQIPACGFSLGLERILVVMEERGMFPPEIAESTAADVMVTIWSEDAIPASLKLANELRSSGIRTIVYPEADKLGKQIKYADSINVPYVCIMGDDEIRERKVKLKNMKTGEESKLAASEIAARITK